MIMIHNFTYSCVFNGFPSPINSTFIIVQSEQDTVCGIRDRLAIELPTQQAGRSTFGFICCGPICAHSSSFLFSMLVVVA